MLFVFREETQVNVLEYIPFRVPSESNKDGKMGEYRCKAQYCAVPPPNDLHHYTALHTGIKKRTHTMHPEGRTIPIQGSQLVERLENEALLKQRWAWVCIRVIHCIK